MEAACRWQGHEETEVMRNCLSFLDEKRPRCVLLENVVGMQDAAEPGELSPLAFLMESLRAMNYVADVYTLDTRVFVEASRPRQPCRVYQNETAEQDLDSLDGCVVPSLLPEQEVSN